MQVYQYFVLTKISLNIERNCLYLDSLSFLALALFPVRTFRVRNGVGTCLRKCRKPSKMLVITETTLSNSSSSASLFNHLDIFFRVYKKYKKLPRKYMLDQY